MSNQMHTPIENTERDPLLVKIYEEICTNIRTSDDISFKLLSFVPLISSSGAAILTITKIWADTNNVTIILISLVAIGITFGLFKWEMRNVQKCDWLITCAAEFERSYFHDKPAKLPYTISQFYGLSFQKKPPPLFFWKLPDFKVFGKMPEFQTLAEEEEVRKRRGRDPGIGKTQAEIIIYWTSIAAWLVPIAMAFVRWKLYPGI